MKTVAQLGRLIKAKYPGEYDDMSDAEVGRRVREQYPEYQDFQDVEDFDNFHEAKFETRLEGREEIINDLIEYYRPSRGWFTSWWQQARAEGRVGLLTALNKEQQLLIEQGAMLEKEIIEGKKRAAALRTFVAQNAAALVELRAKSDLIEQAAKEGYTLEIQQQKKLAGDLTDLRIREAGELSKIKVREHEQLKAIDLDARWKEIVQDSDAADLALIGEHLVVKRLRQELTEARRRQHAIKVGDDPPEVKKKLLKDYGKFIKRLEAKIDERETGHILSQNGEAKRQLTEGTGDGRADYPPETDEDSV